MSAGKYSDHRNTKSIDCSKTIGIVATNLGDEHYDKHIQSGARDAKNMNISELQEELTELYESHFQVHISQTHSIIADQ